jgi:hypothetical protein
MGALMAELMADPGTEIVANLAGWWRMVGDSAVLQSRMRLMWERQQATAARDWVNISLSVVGDGIGDYARRPRLAERGAAGPRT